MKPLLPLLINQIHRMYEHIEFPLHCFKDFYYISYYYTYFFAYVLQLVSSVCVSDVFFCNETKLYSDVVLSHIKHI